MTDESDLDALRRQDVTCTHCGVRSRPGFDVPVGRHCEREGSDRVEPQYWKHDWEPTEQPENHA